MEMMFVAFARTERRGYWTSMDFGISFEIYHK